MNTLFFDYYGHPELKKNLIHQLTLTEGKFSHRFFPDGETYLKFDENLENKKIILLSSLHEPNNKILDLYFFAQTAKAQGAKSITLIAPYLPYLRQDKMFNTGESITSIHFAKLLSQSFDEIITVDPHLHRYHSLNEIYSISTHTLSAACLIADWIKNNFLQTESFLIGPDEESLQWVEEIARLSGSDFVVASKQRLGDKEVKIKIPPLKNAKTATAILIDDVISSGQTLIESIKQVKEQGCLNIFCLATHALCSDENFKKVLQAGAKEIISTNSIIHPSNQIDLSSTIAQAIAKL